MGAGSRSGAIILRRSQRIASPRRLPVTREDRNPQRSGTGPQQSARPTHRRMRPQIITTASDDESSRGGFDALSDFGDRSLDFVPPPHHDDMAPVYAHNDVGEDHPVNDAYADEEHAGDDQDDVPEEVEEALQGMIVMLAARAQAVTNLALTTSTLLLMTMCLALLVMLRERY